MTTIDTLELAVLVLGMVILMWDNRFQDAAAQSPLAKRMRNRRPGRSGRAD
jgi:hypothetical protein